MLADRIKMASGDSKKRWLYKEGVQNVPWNWVYSDYSKAWLNSDTPKVWLTSVGSYKSATESAVSNFSTWRTVNMQDLAGYKNLCIDWQYTGAASGYYAENSCAFSFGLATSTTYVQTFSDGVSHGYVYGTGGMAAGQFYPGSPAQIGRTIEKFDIRNFQFNYYITVICRATMTNVQSDIYIFNIWLE